MSLFDRGKVRTEGVKMPATLPAECLGEACPNWQGEVCSSEYEWLTADARVTEGRNRDEPPFVDEAKYVIYGQHCNAATGAGRLVAQRVEIVGPEPVDQMRMMALTGRYGEMPIQVNRAGQTGSIVTIASSEPRLKPEA